MRLESSGSSAWYSSEMGARKRGRGIVFKASRYRSGQRPHVARAVEVCLLYAGRGVEKSHKKVECFFAGCLTAWASKSARVFFL